MVLKRISASRTPALLPFFSGEIALEKEALNILWLFILFIFGLNILKDDPYCLYQMMVDNSSEGNKDSSTEWDSANNGGIFPSHSPSKSPNKKKKQKQTRRSSSLSSSRSKPPHKKVQKVNLTRQKTFTPLYLFQFINFVFFQKISITNSCQYFI